MAVIQPSGKTAGVVRPAQVRVVSSAKSAAGPVAQAAAPRKKLVALDKVSGSKRMRVKELPVFSRQLSAMLLAGMPLVQALDALEDQTSDPNFKTLVSGVKNYLEAGSSFSESLSHYPSVFDTLYINMIRAGESSGQLGEILARVATYLEDMGKLNRKVKAALSYPVAILCVALGIATAMIIFIVPIFAGIFADMNADLPAPTQFLVDMSYVIRHYGLIVVVVLIVLAIAFNKWKQSSAGGYCLAALCLKLPAIGELNRKLATSRFARTFAQLLESGVPILKAMEIVSGATGNKVFEKAVLAARGSVEQGEPLSRAIMKYKCFPKLLVHMMAAGEKSGKVDEMMQNIAGFYDDEVQTMVDGLTSLIEPLLMVFLGVIIGGIVVSLFLPIFKMPGMVGG